MCVWSREIWLALLGSSLIILVVAGAVSPSVSYGQQQTVSVRTADSQASTDRTTQKTSQSKSKKLPGPNDGEDAARQKKRIHALNLLDSIAADGEVMSDIEYQALIRIEAGSILWTIDRERALRLILSAVRSIRGLLDETQQKPEATSKNRNTAQELWFLAIRKIAALDPRLVNQVLFEAHENPNSKENDIKNVWTDEARALLSVASESIERDPQLAARIAEQALPLGLAGYLEFLRRLAIRDNIEAERLASQIISRLNNVSVTPIELRNLIGFALAAERSNRLKAFFYQTIASRLRMELRQDVTGIEISDALSVANTLARAASDSPYWSSQFEEMKQSIAAFSRERSLALPIPPDRIQIDAEASLGPATAGNTQSIRDSLTNAASIRDTKSRDLEYQRLATSAAARSDRSLAEEIMAVIKDDEIRRETTTLVYSPLIRAAIKGSDWNRAQQLAALVVDPLARALIFVSIGREMLQTRTDKDAIIENYSYGLAKLYRDDPSERLAKAYLVIAGPLLELDRDRGADAIRECAHIAGSIKTRANGSDSHVGSAASTWIRYSDPSLRADEALNLPDLLARVFNYIAPVDSDDALRIASLIEHRGLSSLAQLVVIKTILSQTRLAQPARPSDTRIAR